MLKGTYIQNQRGLVLDVAGGRDRNGQNILVWTKHNGRNQKWRIEYLNRKPQKPKKKAAPRKGEYSADHHLYVERPFYIVSKLGSQRYLDNDKRGNKLVVKKENGNESQQWWFDFKRRIIRNKSNNGFCLGAKASGKRRIRVGRKWRNVTFYRLGMLAVNRRNECRVSQVKYHKDGYLTFRINGQVMNLGRDNEGASPYLAKKVGSKNQRWSVIYVDAPKIK